MEIDCDKLLLSSKITLKLVNTKPYKSWVQLYIIEYILWLHLYDVWKKEFHLKQYVLKMFQNLSHDRELLKCNEHNSCYNH